jgi:hypothetical protein
MRVSTRSSSHLYLVERWCARWAPCRVHRQSSMRALARGARRDAARFKGEPFDGCSNEP